MPPRMFKNLRWLIIDQCLQMSLSREEEVAEIQATYNGNFLLYITFGFLIHLECPDCPRKRRWCQGAGIQRGERLRYSPTQHTLQRHCRPRQASPSEAGGNVKPIRSHTHKLIFKVVLRPKNNLFFFGFQNYVN